jgi:RNA polymerase sigma-70 factor (ECF subfamily)
MQQLNEEQRLVMLLHDAEGYTLIELADILQTPIGTLKSRLHRGRNLVREITEMELFGD